MTEPECARLTLEFSALIIRVRRNSSGQMWSRPPSSQKPWPRIQCLHLKQTVPSARNVYSSVRDLVLHSKRADGSNPVTFRCPARPRPSTLTLLPASAINPAHNPIGQSGLDAGSVRPDPARRKENLKKNETSIKQFRL